MTAANAVAERTVSPIVEIRQQSDAMDSQFRAALPAHIPSERFRRVLMTAVQNNADLAKCSRKSLFNAAMKAAQDGLLPDGREGAIVPYKDEATWMPMIGGIRKKVRNSGEIASWDVHAVYENDAFEFELGDEPFIRHRPALTDKGKIIAVYSVAVLKSGEKSRDVMSIEDVEKIRAKSRARGGPWSDPTFYPEMAKKTVARRHSKVLPMSSDLDDLIRRDDSLYDFDGAREEAKAANAGRPQSLAGRLDVLAQTRPTALAAPPPAEVIDPETGEIDPPAEQEGKGDGSASGEKHTEPANDPQPEPTATAAQAPSPDSYIAMAEARIEAADSPEECEQIRKWLNSAEQKKQRELAGVEVDAVTALKKRLDAKASGFKGAADATA
jgi:recombination protein RecT